MDRDLAARGTGDGPREGVLLFNDQLEVGEGPGGDETAGAYSDEGVVAEVDEGLSPADVLGRIEQVSGFPCYPSPEVVGA